MHADTLPPLLPRYQFVRKLNQKDTDSNQQQRVETLTVESTQQKKTKNKKSRSILSAWKTTANSKIKTLEVEQNTNETTANSRKRKSKNRYIEIYLGTSQWCLLLVMRIAQRNWEKNRKAC